MTIEDFRANFGSEYAAMTRTLMFAALLETIDDASPARQSPNEPLANSATAGAALYQQTQGWEALRRFLKTTITEKPQSPRSEETYETPPV